MFISSSFLILILSSASVSYAQSPNSSTTLVSPYSHFDFFKNTELQPCPSNTKTKTDAKSTGLIYWTGGDAKTPNDYCRWIAGTPVVIPTDPTPAAYYPSWPSFVVQLVSLMFTYLGLWMSLRKLNKDTEKRDISLPKTFWIQLPLDIARVLAWYISYFRGLGTIEAFPWLSTVIWTVPFNYIWLLLLLQGKGIDYQSVSQAPVRKNAMLLRIIIALVVVVTIVQWVASLGACIIHYRYTWGGIKTRMYQPLAAVLSDPSTLGPLPPKCLTFLTTTGLPVEFFSSQNSLATFCVQAISFVITTLSALAGLNQVRNRDYRRTYTMLRNSAAGAQSCLLFGALGLVAYAFTGLKDVSLQVTNDQSITGPCTFVVVQMWGIWGFYDVSHDRIFRGILNVLGV